MTIAKRMRTPCFFLLRVTWNSERKEEKNEPIHMEPLGHTKRNGLVYRVRHTLTKFGLIGTSFACRSYQMDVTKRADRSTRALASI